MVSDVNLEGSLGFSDVVRATSALSQVYNSHGGAGDSMSNAVSQSVGKD